MKNQNLETQTNGLTSAGEICSLAHSVVELCDAAIDDPKADLVAQLVAMRSMARSIGALADSATGGQYRGDALQWLGAGA